MKLLEPPVPVDQSSSAANDQTFTCSI